MDNVFLRQVIEADPTLMLQPSVKKAVSQRFADDAKSVREAAVSLVGTFVVQTPEVASAFHSSLLRCLTDEGVSVKKRTVRIFRDVLLFNPAYKGRAAACAVMLRQAANPKEDDSIRDLIYDFFTELWLENDASNNDARSVQLPQSTAQEGPGLDAAVHVENPSGAGIVTPLTPRGSTAIASKDAKEKNGIRATTSASDHQSRGYFAAEQMVEVVRAAGSKDALTSLLKQLMCGLSDADKDRKVSERRKRNVALHAHCSVLVDALIEQLLVLEENRASHGKNFGEKLSCTGANDRSAL